MRSSLSSATSALERQRAGAVAALEREQLDAEMEAVPARRLQTRVDAAKAEAALGQINGNGHAGGDVVAALIAALTRPLSTRSSIVSAIHHGAVNTGGPGLVSLACSAGDHDGYPGAQIGSIQNGSLVLSGPAYVAGPAGAVTPRAVVTSVPPSWLR